MNSQTSYTNNMKTIKSYQFGYDVDNVKLVQQHVMDNYSADHYNLHVAGGDDVMNSMNIYRHEDLELDQLIDCCAGAGQFEE